MSLQWLHICFVRTSNVNSILLHESKNTHSHDNSYKLRMKKKKRKLKKKFCKSVFSKKNILWFTSNLKVNPILVLCWNILKLRNYFEYFIFWNVRNQRKQFCKSVFFNRKIYCDSHQILKWTLCLFYAEIFCYIFLFHAGTVCKWMNCIAVSANSRSNLHDLSKQYSQVKWQYIDDTVKTWQNNTTILDVMMTLVHVRLACQLHARQPYNDKMIKDLFDLKTNSSCTQ